MECVIVHVDTAQGNAEGRNWPGPIGIGIAENFPINHLQGISMNDLDSLVGARQIDPGKIQESSDLTQLIIF